MEDYDKAIELDPNDAEAYNSRGGAYTFLGRDTLAEVDGNKACQLNPQRC